MTRTSTTRLENRDLQRIFSSPVALAFVRTVMDRRGISEAEARKIYLDYLNRSKPAGNRGSYRQILVTAGPVRRRRFWADGQPAWQ